MQSNHDLWKASKLIGSRQAAASEADAAATRGALTALLMVNEHLEAELQQFYAAIGQDTAARGKFLH